MIAPLTKTKLSNRRSEYTLFWKEFSEGKSIITWVVCLLIAFLVGNLALQAMTLDAGERLQISGSTETQILFLVWYISAALSSSSIISPDLGGANLQFLSSLPLSRKRIWWTKLLSMLAIHVIAVAESSFLFFALYYLADQIGLNTQVGQYENVVNFSVGVALYTLPVFSVGTIITVFVDRTIASLFLTAVVSIALAALLLGIQSTLTVVHQWLVIPLTAVISLIFLSISFELFVHGETLRTNKRLIILRDIGFNYILPILGALIIAYFWIIL